MKMLYYPPDKKSMERIQMLTSEYENQEHVTILGFAFNRAGSDHNIYYMYYLGSGNPKYVQTYDFHISN